MFSLRNIFFLFTLALSVILLSGCNSILESDKTEKTPKKPKSNDSGVLLELNDVERQEIDEIYKKNKQDRDAKHRKIFGGL